MTEGNVAPQDTTATVDTTDSYDVETSEDEGGLYETEEIADYLDGGEETEGQPENEPAQPEPEQAPEQKEAIAAPNSWSKADQAVFANLPPAAQEVIARRERERDAFVAAKAQETAQARQNHDQLWEYANTAIENALAQASVAIDGEFAGIDMIQLQRDDPQTFLRIDAMYKQRMGKIQEAMQRLEEMKGYRAQQAEARKQQFLKEQMIGLADKVAKITGNENFNAVQWKDEAVQYLSSIGCPVEHINDVNYSYQIELIAKAMEYDKMQKNLATANQKIATAPKVMRPGQQAYEGDVDAQQKRALKNLYDNPSSTDAIARALELGL